MENQVRSDALTKSWLVSPVFDLLFVANLGWIGALAIGLLLSDGVSPLQFWQMYFLTTPHRWLTLVLVALDPDRREGRNLLFLFLPILFLCLIVGVQMQFGVLLCLALIDYVWNGWHFASQHVGVLRIYGRKAGDGSAPFERHGLRAFIFYVILRTAGWSTGWLEQDEIGALVLQCADWLFAVLVLAVVVNEFRYWRRHGALTHNPSPQPSPARGEGEPVTQPRSLDHGSRIPKRCYLASVCALYSALLLALHVHWVAGITVLTVAAAAFHAIEYLAIVTHYAWQRQSVGSSGLFQRVSQYWLLLLAAYLLAIGTLDWMMQSAQRGWWIGANLWAALLHYAYDGLIWKLRKPATARALGAGGEP